MINANNTKIFSIYYKEAKVYNSDIITPIFAGADIYDCNLDILKDNTADNISSKNNNYGELTAWYWVWKNYLSQNPQIENVGFCHYRRILDLSKSPCKKAYKKVWESQFNKIINNYAKNLKKVAKYDIVLSGKRDLKNHTTYSEFASLHPKSEWDILMNVLAEKYPDYYTLADEVFNMHTQYHCLNFIMRKDLFNDFATWSFDILFEYERRTDLTKYTSYQNIRMPAFLLERFFNLWFLYQQRHNNISYIEKKGCMLRPLEDKIWIIRKLQRFGLYKIK